MRIAICDFDGQYVSSLLTYLYGKCSNNDFATFTTIEDYEIGSLNEEFDYQIMGDEFYEVIKAELEEQNKRCNFNKLIILNTSLEHFIYEDACQVIYKYGPMDGLHRLIEGDGKRASIAKIDKVLSADKDVQCTKVFTIYSPTHHELTEMYALSMCQMLGENNRVLMVNTMKNPVVKKLIRDGPKGSIVDTVYKLENDRAWEIRELIETYDVIDIYPIALDPMDIVGISRRGWCEILEYVKTLDYDAIVIAVDEIHQGFKEMIEQSDCCLLINKRGDYYKSEQEIMKEYIGRLCPKVSCVELMMSAKNLNEGCYQIEELLSGNLGRCVRAQNNITL